MRNGSSSEYYLAEGGLKLTRMRQSEWRRRWGILGIQVFEVRVAASADDGFVDSAGAFSDGGAQIRAGEFGVVKFHDSWMRFDPVTIPAGATVTTAYISFIVSGGSHDGVGVKSKLHMEAVDDAVAPADKAAMDAKSRTAAFATWDDADYGDEEAVDSPSIVTAVQEVLDRGGWASGQAMQALWDDNTSDDQKIYRMYSYDGDSAKAPLLHVEYST